MPISARGIAYDVLDFAAPWRPRAAPILFLHGIGANRQCWAEWVDVLGGAHRLIQPDLRGFAQSAGLPMSEPLIDTLIDDVLELMPDGEACHLVGESAGGSILLELALRHPTRVASLTMSNAAIVGRQIGEIGGWQALFDAGGDVWNDHMMDCRFAPGSLTTQAWDWYRQQQGRARAEPAMAIAAMLAGIDQRRALPGLKPPLMVLLPGDSPFVPVSMFDELSIWLPQSIRHVFPGVRHGLPFSHGRQCALLLKDFLARQSRG